MSSLVYKVYCGANEALLLMGRPASSPILPLPLNATAQSTYNADHVHHLALESLKILIVDLMGLRIQKSPHHLTIT